MTTCKEENLMVCPYFLKSTCREGDNCEFSHSMTDVLPEKVPCEFYLNGYCKYGKKCWLAHEKPSDDTKPDDTKIKKRITFILKDLQETRMKISSEMTKYFPEMRGNETQKLPMERCIHYEIGSCPLRKWCPCLHGNLCDLCQKYCLDPYDKEQNALHIEQCEKELERDMELSFGIQCSKDKTCGICLEVILDKEVIVNRRFGILEKCNHVFCLECIREWRRRVNDNPEVDQRKCPQCRIRSDFVIPSNFWFYCKEEKTKLIDKYKSHLSKKHCKYYKQGEGDCPFGNRCFYLHALPDGTVVELPPPARANRRRPNIQIMLRNYLEANEDVLQFYMGESNFVL